MPDYILAPRAIEDLTHIWDSTLHKWGEAQADNYTDALDFRCAWLAENPSLGKARNDVRKRG